MSVFPKRVEPIYENIVDGIMRKYDCCGYGDMTSGEHKEAAEEYAKQYLEYHRPKPILVVKGRQFTKDVANEVANDLNKHIPDWHIVVEFGDKEEITHEIVSLEDLTPEQKQRIAKLVNNQQTKITNEKRI